MPALARPGSYLHCHRAKIQRLCAGDLESIGGCSIRSNFARAGASARRALSRREETWARHRLQVQSRFRERFGLTRGNGARSTSVVRGTRAAPALEQLMDHAKLIADTADDKIDGVFKGTRS